MCAFDEAVRNGTERVLFDDVRLLVLDAFEPVRDVEPVADFLDPRLDEVKLGRVGEPAGDERRRILGTGALAEAGRNECSKLDGVAEARCDRRHVLGSD